MGFDIRDLDNINIMSAPEGDLIALIHRFKEDGLAGDRIFRDRAIKANNFFNGYQWSTDDMARMIKERRPFLTFNILKKTVEFLVGTQEQNRKDITVKPVRNGTNSQASILTKLVKDTISKNNGEHLISEWMRGGCVKGRSFLHLYRDFELDPWTGDLKIEVVDGLDVAIDSNSKMYDMSDSKFFIIFKYVNRDKVIAEYPEQASRLISLRTNDEIDNDSDEIFLNGGGDLNTEAVDAEEERYTNRDIYRFRVQWSYIKKTERRWHLINKQDMTDTIISNKLVDFYKAKEAENPQVLKLVQRADSILYLVKSVNDIILERIREPFKMEDSSDDEYRNPINKFPVIPYGAHFDTGRWEGVIDALICPQEEKNKMRSSALHVICAISNKSIAVPKGTLEDDDMYNLRTHGNATGQVFEYDPVKGPPATVGDSDLPSGLWIMAEQSNKDIMDISGITAANLGQTVASESGKAQELRQIQGITVNTSVFDQLDYSMKILGEMIVGIIRSTQLYTMEEIELIVEDFDIFEDRIMAEANQSASQIILVQMINMGLASPTTTVIPSLQEIFIAAEAETPESQAILQEQYNGLMQQLNAIAQKIAKQLVLQDIHNLHKGQYGISIAMSNWSPTVKNANMSTALAINQAAPGIIPADYLLKMSDLPDKEPIMKQIQANREAAQKAAIAQEQLKIQGQMMLQKAKNEGKVAEVNAKANAEIATDNVTSEQ